MVQPPISSPAMARQRRVVLLDQTTSSRMRRHLQGEADAAKLSIKQLAERAEIPPTSLYNFLKGDSAQLSNATIWALAGVLPDLNLNLMLNVPEGMPQLMMPRTTTAEYEPEAIGPELAADLARVPERSASAPIAAVDVVELRMEARAGVTRRLSLLDQDERMLIGMPKPPHVTGRMFGVRVEAPGAEQLWRTGTLLGCTPIKTGPDYADRIAQLVPGRRVVVVRTPGSYAYGRNSETTVREISGDGVQRSLVLRSRKAIAPVAIPMPAGFDGSSWRHEAHQVRIVGLVEVACQLEEPGARA